ncbi:MAG: helix-turn-helix domain-containing protein [Beijerinckiaceae bacterium]
MAKMQLNTSNLSKAAYSIAETAQLCSVGRNAIYNLINSGQMKSIRIGARRLISAAEIARLLNESQESKRTPKSR